MIVSGHLLYAEPIKVSGLLIVGDPHVSSKRPGRRKDATWPDPILRKLEFCVETANARGLAMLLLGDLFDESLEEDEALKTRVSRILKAAVIPPIANVGNHDKANAKLSDCDSLSFLAVNDALDVIRDSGPVCVFDLDGMLLGLGMTPYGQDIPTDVTGQFEGVNAVMWCTHHDIAFDETYPKAVHPFPITGCKIVINGHVHARKKPVRAGETMWLNPGNINRQSVDLIDHVPAAWILDGRSNFEPVELPHGVDVFDLTGRLVDPSTPEEVAASVESAFVTILKAQESIDSVASDDGAMIREDIEAKFERDKTPADIRAIVNSLLSEAISRRAA